MLYPVDNEVRQIKELNGIWKFRKDNYYRQGFEEKWFEKPLENVIDMPVPSSYNDITTDSELRVVKRCIMFKNVDKKLACDQTADLNTGPFDFL